MRLYHLLASVFGGCTQSTRKSIALNLSHICRIETLESRRLLAVDWLNQWTNNFANFYTNDDDAVIAEALVERAIDDWNRVITDQDWDNDADPDTNGVFNLTVLANSITGRGLTQVTSVTTAGGGRTEKVPVEATITLDDNGGGAGWFFDATPLDDVEFTGIADAFQTSFIDSTTVGQAHQNDFYRTITHEIGHALGVYLVDTNVEPLLDRLFTMTTDIGDDPLSTNSADRLRQFGTGAGAVTLTTNGGGHTYEGTAAAPVHPNDLMNPGRTVPGSPVAPFETVRQFISDLDVQLLADAYGYTVTLPSDLPDFTNPNPDPGEDATLFSSGTAHILYDANNSTLLVQGLAKDPGNPNLRVDDTINITQVGANIRVNLTYTPNGRAQRNFVRDIESSRVEHILIAGNGGTDAITNDLALDPLVEIIHYVVSSNADDLEAAGQSTSDGIVDLSNIVPGNQTTLRAAIVEANAGTGGTQSIYVGRGQYNLTRTGSEGNFDGSVNDLDIFGMSTLSIIGAGAGQTVINGGGNDRIFDIVPGGVDRVLDLSRVTLTGGQMTAGGFTGYGGAVRVGDTAELRLTDSALVDNEAVNSYGGAVTVVANGTAIIERSVFANNQAGAAGGAVALMPSNTQNRQSEISTSVFAGNTVGGIQSKGVKGTFYFYG